MARGFLKTYKRSNIIDLIDLFISNFDVGDITRGHKSIESQIVIFEHKNM